MRGNKKFYDLIVKKSALVIMVKIVGALLAYLMHVYIARVLGAEQYGIYSFVFSWLMLLSLFSSFGFEHLQARFVAEYKAKKEFWHLRGLVKTSHQFVLLLGSLVALVTISILVLLRGKISEELNYSFMLGSLMIPLIASVKANSGVLRGLKKQLEASALGELLRPALLFFFTALLVLMTNELTTISTMAATVGSFFIVFAISLLLVKRLIWGASTENSDVLVPQSGEIKTAISWGITAIPFIMYVGVFQLEKNIDVMMLGSMSDMKSVGVFAAVQKITGLMLIVTMTLNVVASPVFSELYALGKRKQLQRVVTLVARLSAGLALLIYLVIHFLGESILGLFGSEYVAGLDALKLMIFAEFIKALAGPVLMLSVMTGYQVLALKIIGVGTMLHFSLNLLLIPDYGVYGAALSASVSIVLWSAYLAYKLSRNIHVNPTVFSRI